MNLLDKFVCNKNGRVVIWQNPNPPLYIWAFATAGRRLFDSGLWNTFFEAVAFGALFTWAYLEVTQGASLFRRLVGAIILVAMLANTLK